ncbi:septum formation initiator family protein [Cellulomonas sp. P22]|uniref:septum formation initiator family protein n=1 Tax=Cellulomonas sp. P22 TaxID=3373189 RepID=UPI0037BA6DDE
MRVPRLFTARVMVLGVVLMIAFVLVFPTLRSYLTQRVELEQLNAQVEDARARNEELTAAVARWSDDAYVIAQARERLAFVLPGETAYRVEDPENAPSTTAAPDTDVPDTDVPGATDGAGSATGTPWYAAVWDSVRIADGADAEAEPDAGSPETAPADVPAP